MDEKENELALALINHMNDTFVVITKMKSEADFKRNNRCDTNQAFLRESLYNSYLQAIYNDAFILSNITDHFNFYVQSIMKLYDGERNNIDTELKKIISRLIDETI